MNSLDIQLYMHNVVVVNVLITFEKTRSLVCCALLEAGYILNAFHSTNTKSHNFLLTSYLLLALAVPKTHR